MRQTETTLASGLATQYFSTEWYDLGRKENFEVHKSERILFMQRKSILPYRTGQKPNN